MSYKERSLGGDSQGLEVSRRAAGSTAVMVPRMATTAALADLLAWRCRHGRCVARPLHDRLDWWPAWAIERRRSA